MRDKWEYLDEYLQKSMKAGRYTHAKRVSDVAENLAVLYGADPEKARLAGLIHDCARDFGPCVLLQKAREFDILIDTLEQCVPVLLHGSVGAAIAEWEFGLSDPELLNAVRFHTTGRENMSVLEKIIYLADYIEPGRALEGVEDVRCLVYANLDRGLLRALDASISYMVRTGGLIHTRTIQSRNWILYSLSELED